MNSASDGQAEQGRDVHREDGDIENLGEPDVTVTAMPPPMTGRAAATSVPKMRTSTRMATGMV